MKLKAEFKPEILVEVDLVRSSQPLKTVACEAGGTLKTEFSSGEKRINASCMFERSVLGAAFTEYQALQGHTPVRGVDYFTQADVDEIARRTYELVQTGGADTSSFIKVSQIGENLELDKNNKLNVVTTDLAEGDNTKPITSRAVNTIVGNIDVLLGII